MELADKPKYGANPDVFYYQFTDPDQLGIYLVKLCFYKNVYIYIAYTPADIEKPYHIGFDLMNKGIKTIIRVGDKESKFD